jgi:hypothetical protein
VALDNHRNDDWKPYLFKTTDFGKSWTNLTGNLPTKGNINALREDYDNPNLLFVGTEFGLYMTLEGGKEWRKFMNGLPSVRVDDILIHPRDRDLIVATNGRSIWIADDITPLEQYKMNPNSDVVLYEPRPAVQWKSDPSTSRNPTARDFRGQNPQGGTAIHIWSKSDASGAKLDFLQGTNVVSTMNVDLKAGMNRVQWNMQRSAQGAAGTATGGGGGRGGRAGGGGRAGRGGQAAQAGDTAQGGQAGQAAPAAGQTPAAGAATPQVSVQQVLTDAVGGAFGFGGGGGGGGGGRGGAGRGGVPFVAGGRGGGGGNMLEPGVYMVRLTVGEKTYNSSVNVLEDIWARPQ